MVYFHGKTLVCSQTSEVLPLESTLTQWFISKVLGVKPVDSLSFWGAKRPCTLYLSVQDRCWPSRTVRRISFLLN